MFCKQLTKGFQVRYDVRFEQDLGYTHASTALGIAWKEEAGFEIFKSRNFFLASRFAYNFPLLQNIIFVLLLFMLRYL